MFPFLSSARIHLNSRCLSQAVFDSGSVDFDAEVIRPSSWRGSVLCCRSRRCLVPVRAPSPAPGRDPAAAAHQQRGWGAAPAGLLTAPGGAGGSAQRPWLRSPAELRRKTTAPRDGTQQVLRLVPGREQSRNAWPPWSWEVLMPGQCKSLSSQELGILQLRCSSSRCFFSYWQCKAMKVPDECKNNLI